MSSSETKIDFLSRISSPEDFKNIPDDQMPKVAAQIREVLVDTVTRNGGHLASNLGVVEMTMAIHKVFDSPKDHIIFDVGHQSYVHKLLTGRYKNIDTLRRAGGLCGFTNRDESEHDCFGAGHSSTSLSAGLGFAISDKLSGSDAHTVVVLGDGAYTGGMIHEALNNSQKALNLIIILNENEMSISKNIGRFAQNLSRLRTRPGYFKTKRATGRFLRKIPLIGNALFNFALGIKKAFKNLLYGSNYFESMGYTYLGPIDGNDYKAVTTLLREAKRLNESVVVHIKTQKGKGYAPAEQAPDVYHGMSPCTAENSQDMTFSAAMGKRLTELAAKNDKICAITAAMCDGTGLNEFKATHSERFFDVGIAEEHALTFAAGLAANGMKPAVAVYSTFLQRGYDNIVHDIALQNLPVVIFVDRAGLNSADGATHHGIFDVSFLSHIPNMTVYTPITLDALYSSMYAAFSSDSPCAIRYPNGREDETIKKEFYSTVQAGDIFDLSCRANFDPSDDPRVIIITHGRITAEAIKASQSLHQRGIHCGIILLEMLKPYDIIAGQIADMMPESAELIVFLEEEIRAGGMGISLSDKLKKYDSFNKKKNIIMAVDDSFVKDRKPEESILESASIDAQSIYNHIVNNL